MKKIHLFIPFICIILFFAGCAEKEKQEVLIQGKTMGTTFHIKVISSENIRSLEEKINERLKEINQSMSTYIKNSEISRFNQLKNINEKFPVSKDFLKVMMTAEELYQLTEGAWDGTIDPLINLWGFGREKKEHVVPSSDEIEAILPNIGFRHIEISADGYLRKKSASLTLDLASIAKGYGVDQVAAVIEEHGIKDYLVEIGGEIYASGVRLDGGKWRIGINKPEKGAAYDEVYKVAVLQNKAFATSGDYRNFFEADGKRYSHVLDPGTGYAVSNRVVSVSVIADNCTFADGLATALMVMGSEKGIEKVNQMENAECLIIVEEKDGTLKDYYSKGFKTES